MKVSARGVLPAPIDRFFFAEEIESKRATTHASFYRYNNFIKRLGRTRCTAVEYNVYAVDAQKAGGRERERVEVTRSPGGDAAFYGERVLLLTAAAAK